MTVDESSVKEFISLGLLEVIKVILASCQKSVRKEALWLLSNISANSENDSRAII